MVFTTLLVLVSVLGLYGTAEAVVSVIGGAGAVDGSTIAYTAPNGTDRIAIAFVTADGNTTAVTIGTCDATLIAENTGITTNTSSAWYCAIGNGSGETLDVSATTGNNPTVSIVVFGGADQGSPVFSANATDSNNSAAPAPLIDVPADGRAAYIQNSNGDNGTSDLYDPPTNGGTWTELFDFGAASNHVTAGYRDATTAITGLAVNTTDNGTGSNRGSMAAFSISATPVAGPGTIQLSAATYNVDETGGSVTITVTRTGGITGAVGISYATSNGTALAGSDYSAASGTLSWADSEGASKTFNITITDDPDTEGTEDFNVTLSSPTGGATLGSPSSASVTINDDEAVPPPQVPASSTTLLMILFAGMAIYVMKYQKRERNSSTS
jgi:hypothetical protein